MSTVRESRDGWTRIVNDMVARGAVATPDEVQQVIAFLADHFGTSSTGAPMPLERSRPSLTVTGAYDAKCAACHGAKMTGSSGPSVLGYVR